MVSKLDYFDEKWRSPSGLTREVIQQLRDEFAARVAKCTIIAQAHWAKLEADRLELLALEEG